MGPDDHTGVMMKKAGWILLAGAALAGTVQAQSSVQLMGLVDVYAGRARMAGDAASRNVVNSGGMTTSWWGMRGTEELGGGLKANFLLTGFFQADTGVSGRFANDPLFSRDANVSLAGGFGALALGRMSAPNFLPTILFNPYGDSFVFSPLVLHNNVGLFNGTNWAATTPSDTGWSNQVAYTTPSFNGLTARVQYQFGESATRTSANNVGVHLLYLQGPWGATAFYERDEVSNPVAPAPFATGDEKTDWMVGGSYDFTAAKLFATHGRTRSNLLVPRARTSSLGAAIPVGAGKVNLATARTKVTPGNTRRTTTVGYDYFLSKNTDVYANVMRDSLTNFSSGTSWGVGIRQRF
jgi:predicted porin